MPSNPISDDANTGSIRAVVIGAAGYTGRELIALLAAHPVFQLAGLFGSARSAPGTPIADLHPSLRGVTDVPVHPYEGLGDVPAGTRLVFLATPHEASADLAPDLVDAGLTVVDLSAAFRLSDPAAYPIHYGFTHPRPDLLASAVYGLPELHRVAADPGAGVAIANARLIAAAGCYPTASTLAIAPLLAAGLIAPGSQVIIDATSGVSGAGKQPRPHTSFCEVSQTPYGVFNHRHHPEIETHSGCRVVFTPHLGAYDRGILATVHATLAEGVGADAVRAAFERAFGHEPFIRLLPEGVYPSVGAVRGTNFADIAVAVSEERRHAIVFSAIDNLMKGASSQAVQCANAAFEVPETLGLLPASLAMGAMERAVVDA